MRTVVPKSLRPRPRLNLDLEFREALRGAIEQVRDETSSIPSKPIHSLHQLATVGFRDLTSELIVRGPQYLSDTTRHSYLMCITAPRRTLMYLRGEERAVVAKELLRGLTDGRGKRPGSIRKLESGEIEFRFPIRRGNAPSESAICAACFTKQLSYPDWHGGNFLPRFYSKAIAPNATREARKTPLDWAKERIEIATGYAANIHPGDLPFKFVSFPFEQVASSVSNTTPKSYRTPRVYKLSPENKALYIAGREAFGRSFGPEIASFLLEHSDSIAPQMLKRPSVVQLSRSLPKLLGNGLLITRVSELYQSLLAHDLTSEAALDHTASIIESVYGAKNRPWWFHENFDLRPENCSPVELELERRIAAESGFAFQHVRESWKLSGDSISKLLPVEKAIDVVIFVTQRYGIGNPARASSVIDYINGVLSEAKPEARERVLGCTLEMLERRKPVSAIAGLLEGDKATFSTPGLTALRAVLLPEMVEREDNGWERFLTAKEIKELSNVACTPLEKRHNLIPPLLPEYMPEELPLLLELKPPGYHELPIPPELANASKIVQGRTSSWLLFERKLHVEARHDPERTAQKYFLFFANKLPDPLNPPTGFLGFLDKFLELPDPELKFTALYPIWKRQEILDKNTRKNISKMLIISEIVDCVNSGLLKWEDAEAQLNHIFKPISKELQKRIQIDRSWREVEGQLSGYHYHMQYLADADANLIASQRGNSHWCSGEFKGRHIASKLEELKFFGSDRLEHIERYASDLDFDRSNLGLILEREMGSDRNAVENPEAYYSRQSSSDEARSEISRIDNKKALERLHRLRDAAVGLRTLRELLNLGFLSNLVDKSPARSLLKPLLSDHVSPLGKPYVQEISPTQVARTLRELVRYDVFDHLAFNRDVEHVNRSPETLPKLLYRLVRTAYFGSAAWTNIDNITEHLFKEPWVNGTPPIEEILPTIEGNHVKDAYLKHPAVGSLTQPAPHWLFRYSKLIPVMEPVRQYFQTIPKPDLLALPLHAKVADANATFISSAIFHMGAATIDRSDGRHFESILSLPSTRTPVEIDRDKNSDSLSPLKQIDINQSELTERLMKFRRDSFGLLPVGGKIHVLHPIDKDHIEFLVRWLKLDSTSFTLQHSSRSLVLPALPSSKELKLLISFLDTEHAIDWDHPELQICIPGRLPPDVCALLGSFILLSTDRGVRYERDSFETNQNKNTGYRIMSYDKDHPVTPYPFGSPLYGRTDIFGRQTLSDIDLYQLVGSVISHGLTNGPFANISAPLIDNYRSILSKYGLSSVLKASWILEPGRQVRPDDGDRHFQEAVKPCVDAWFSSNQDNTKQPTGIVAEMDQLLSWLITEVRFEQAKMLKDPAYDVERNILFGDPFQGIS